MLHENSAEEHRDLNGAQLHAHDRHLRVVGGAEGAVG